MNRNRKSEVRPRDKNNDSQFQLFSIFLHHLILTKLATIDVRVKTICGLLIIM